MYTHANIFSSWTAREKSTYRKSVLLASFSCSIFQIISVQEPRVHLHTISIAGHLLWQYSFRTHTQERKEKAILNCHLDLAHKKGVLHYQPYYYIQHQHVRCFVRIPEPVVCSVENISDLFC